MANSIPVVWTAHDLEQLPFEYRCDFETTLSMIDPQDAERYRGRIGLSHHNGADIAEQFGLMDQFNWLTDCVYAVHLMPPGNLLPNHSDNYRSYCQRRGLEDFNSITRVIVFLQDWQPGHILQIDQQLHAGWKAGDWVAWTGSTSHLAANLGSTNRYTLQITGQQKGIL